MENSLKEISKVPITTAALASLFPDVRAGNQKVRSLERHGDVIRLKKGLYVVSPAESGTMLSAELIANHIYAPSFVSMSSALRFYGLIPETVYTVQSMTIKHSRTFNTPLGRFDYKTVERDAFSVGVSIARGEGVSFLIATPERALCDLIASSPQVNLRYRRDVERYLEDDIRMSVSDLLKMDVSVFEKYAAVGKKANSIMTLIEYLRK